MKINNKSLKVCLGLVVVLMIFLLPSSASAATVPMRIWSDVFMEGLSATQHADWATSMGADVISITEDYREDIGVDIGQPQLTINEVNKDIAYWNSRGLKVWLGLDPVLNHRTEPNTPYDITNATVRAQRIAYVKHYIDIYPGITGLEYEELNAEYGSGDRIAAINDLLQQTGNYAHARGMQISFNIAQMNAPFTSLGFDMQNINDNHLVDAIIIQSSEYNVNIAVDQYNNFKSILPNIPIIPCAYGWTAKVDPSPAFFQIVDYFNTRGISVQITQVQDMDRNAASLYPELQNTNLKKYLLSPSTDTINDVMGRIPIKGASVIIAIPALPTVAPTRTITTTLVPTSITTLVTKLALNAGWNQISSPLATGIDLSTIEATCTILPYKTYKLWSWDGKTQSWTNPARVEPFKGYWINIARACTVPLSGTPAKFTSVELYSGWNNISASGVLSAIKAACSIVGSQVWNWDTVNNNWTHPSSLRLDKGYWINITGNCILG